MSMKINENSTWKELTFGSNIYESMSSESFKTGDWRTEVPEFIAEKCKQCMLCLPVCPDSSIPMENGKRLDFNFNHCKGCGICAKVCPFDAIIMKKEEK